VQQLVEELTRHIGCDVFTMGTYADGARTDALAWKLLHNLVLVGHAGAVQTIEGRTADLQAEVARALLVRAPHAGMSTRILLQNTTDFELTRGRASGVSSGEWWEGLPPPSTIQSGHIGLFGSVARSGVLSSLRSTGGTVFYIIRTCKYGTVQLEVTWTCPRFSSFNVTYSVWETVMNANGGPGTWGRCTSFVVEEVAGSRKVRGHPGTSL
jgi:hypothetical protein